MGAFEYTALDSAGRSRKGVIEGDTARHVRSLLREKQLLPVTIAAVADEASRKKSGARFSLRRGVSAADLSLMTRQLSTLVRAGLPLEEALLAALVGLLGPILIVGMGLIVMGIVFAMLLPIFEMNQLIR